MAQKVDINQMAEKTGEIAKQFFSKANEYANEAGEKIHDTSWGRKHPWLTTLGVSWAVGMAAGALISGMGIPAMAYAAYKINKDGCNEVATTISK